MTKISARSTRRMTRLRAGVSAIALVIGAGLLLAPGSASAGIFNDTLCGSTISTHVTAKDDSDNVAGDCVITILDGASLTIKDYNLNVEGELQIDGEGDASFSMHRTTLATKDDFHVNLDSGNAAIVDDNDLSIGTGAGSLSIHTASGDIIVKDNLN